MSFRGKVAVITGGARGMGRAHALGFAAAGAAVAVLDLGGNRLDLSYQTGGLDELEATAEECRKLSGASSVAVQADVRNAAQVEAAIARAVAELGGLDILVNNAGITTGYKPAHELSESDWDKVVDINLKGVWMCSKYAIPHMIRQRSGKIVNISSVAGLAASPGYAAYVAAKFGVVGLTKTLALELAEYDINVNCVCPTTVDTPMTAADARSYGMDLVEAIPEFAQIHPLKRLPKAEDITRAVMWLASDESCNITGVALPVDAGFTIKPPL